MAIVDRLAQAGPLRNGEMFKPLRDDLFEIKTGRLRIVCFQTDNQEIICTHGFFKNSRKTPDAELKHGRYLRGEFRAKEREGTVELVDEDQG